MAVPGSSPLSDKTLEEDLRQCIVRLESKRLSTCVAGPGVVETATAFLPFENPDRGNEASPKLHHKKGTKHNDLKVAKEKMGQRKEGCIGKKQQRRNTKGNVLVYDADATNFRALVYAHTSMHPASPSANAVEQPASPLTPNSITSTSSPGGITSTSSPWRFSSQPTSPSIPSPVSPLSSPYQAPSSGFYSNHSLQPDAYSLVNNVHSSHFNAHHDLSNFYSFPPIVKCNLNEGLNPNLAQSTWIPRCVSTLSFDALRKCDEVPCNSDRSQGTSPFACARSLSLERYLMEDNTNVEKGQFLPHVQELPP